ncbi:MAG: hypothetical protein KDB37_07110 [Ilumatobacter sp.]|nr:hypothetical protein [Ilumatobacter sp.]
MARLLLAFAVAIPFLALGFALGAWWAPRGVPTASDRELEYRERIATLQHHTELLEQSRKASLAGDAGLANIYAEAAERVLELVERERPD